jgi:hypothetical protein
MERENMKVTAKDVAELADQVAIWFVNGRLEYRSTFLGCDLKPNAPVKVTADKKLCIQAGYSVEEIVAEWQNDVDFFLTRKNKEQDHERT